MHLSLSKDGELKRKVDAEIRRRMREEMGGLRPSPGGGTGRGAPPPPPPSTLAPPTASTTTTSTTTTSRPTTTTPTPTTATSADAPSEERERTHRRRIIILIVSVCICFVMITVGAVWHMFKSCQTCVQSIRSFRSSLTIQNPRHVAVCMKGQMESEREQDQEQDGQEEEHEDVQEQRKSGVVDRLAPKVRSLNMAYSRLREEEAERDGIELYDLMVLQDGSVGEGAALPSSSTSSTTTTATTTTTTTTTTTASVTVETGLTNPIYNESSF